MLGHRLISNLYELHEGLIRARYDREERVQRLEILNATRRAAPPHASYIQRATGVSAMYRDAGAGEVRQ